MKMKKEQIKKTRLGRVLCKVLGDESGAVAMEYVMIGMLVAAAVVGLVAAFGGAIGDTFKTMISALTGDQGSVQTSSTTANSNADAAVKAGKITMDTVQTHKGGSEE